MPSEPELLEAWRTQRTSGSHFFRLEAQVLQSFEYKGPQWGHPSNYAAVRFRCQPADALLFISQARWPVHVSIAYQADLERTIGYAIVDTLMNIFYPYRACSVTLIVVGWDDVMSSEMAFYRAASGAMEELKKTAKWRLLTIGSENPS
jgi:hypothetical protein